MGVFVIFVLEFHPWDARLAPEQENCNTHVQSPMYNRDYRPFNRWHVTVRLLVFNVIQPFLLPTEKSLI